MKRSAESIRIIPFPTHRTAISLAMRTTASCLQSSWIRRGEAGAGGYRPGRCHQSENWKSHACRYAYTAAQIYSRLSHRPGKLDFHSSWRHGCLWRDLRMDRQKLCNHHFQREETEDPSAQSKAITSKRKIFRKIRNTSTATCIIYWLVTKEPSIRSS